MDTGIEKTRRNLLATMMIATIYVVADLTPSNATGGLFNFTVGNPTYVIWLFVVGIIYLWIRYLTYYFQENIPRKRKLSQKKHIGRVALEYFEKNNPERLTAKDAEWHGCIFEPHDPRDQYSALEPTAEHIRITGIEDTPHLDTEDYMRIGIYEFGHTQTGKDYNAILRKSRWSFPFMHSYILEKDIPAILPILFFGFFLLWYLIPAPTLTFNVADIRVLEADTFSVYEKEYRISGVDAFEKKQKCFNNNGMQYSCGVKAIEALRAILKNNAEIKCKQETTDKYKNVAVQCWAYKTQDWLNNWIYGMDIAATLVTLGWAVDHTYYSNGKYKPEERRAKASNSGAWAGCFANPYKWRNKEITVQCQ